MKPSDAYAQMAHSAIDRVPIDVERARRLRDADIDAPAVLGDRHVVGPAAQRNPLAHLEAPPVDDVEDGAENPGGVPGLSLEPEQSRDAARVGHHMPHQPAQVQGAFEAPGHPHIATGIHRHAESVA